MVLDVLSHYFFIIVLIFGLVLAAFFLVSPRVRSRGFAVLNVSAYLPLVVIGILAECTPTSEMGNEYFWIDLALGIMVIPYINILSGIFSMKYLGNFYLPVLVNVAVIVLGAISLGECSVPDILIAISFVAGLTFLSSLVTYFIVRKKKGRKP